MKNWKTFLDFVTNYKLKKMAKKLSDDKLLDLYYRYGSMYWIPGFSFRDKVHGSLVILAVITELKSRYPHNKQLREYHYDKEINLEQILNGGNSNESRK